jgi:hypothetical protein
MAVSDSRITHLRRFVMKLRISAIDGCLTLEQPVAGYVAAVFEGRDRIVLKPPICEGRQI